MFIPTGAGNELFRQQSAQTGCISLSLSKPCLDAQKMHVARKPDHLLVQQRRRTPAIKHNTRWTTKCHCKHGKDTGERQRTTHVESPLRQFRVFTTNPSRTQARLQAACGVFIFIFVQQPYSNPIISGAREMLQCRTATERNLQRAQCSLRRMKEAKDNSSSLDFLCES